MSQARDSKIVLYLILLMLGIFSANPSLFAVRGSYLRPYNSFIEDEKDLSPESKGILTEARLAAITEEEIISLKDKNVLVIVDYNLPLEDGEVKDNTNTF